MRIEKKDRKEEREREIGKHPRCELCNDLVAQTFENDGHYACDKCLEKEGYFFRDAAYKLREAILDYCVEVCDKYTDGFTDDTFSETNKCYERSCPLWEVSDAWEQDKAFRAWCGV